MPRTNLPVTSLVGNPSGIAPTTEVAIDATNGNVIPSYSKTMWLEITCTVTGPVNFTLVTPVSVGSRAVPDDTYAISGIGTKRRFGPFDPNVYGKDLQFDGPATITVAAYQTVLQ